MSPEGVRLFGVRHHGPGSARSLVRALEAFDPDAVLIEGPPDANDLLPLASHVGLEPPVALLVYAQEMPSKAVMYPFATFSPEWQAALFALERQRPVRFIDLPHTHRFADSQEVEDDAPKDEADGKESGELRADPLRPLALAAGYGDTERWWDHLVESRQGSDLEVFGAVHEMMSAVRSELQWPEPLTERRREAYMRKSIRTARSEGFARIAVVCGAYHTPALAQMPSAKQDDEVLRGLPKVKTAAAWVPWSYERLASASGYGAGIVSPVWYELLWDKPSALGAEWLTRAARLLRAEDIPASSAHVIEACRLADTLAAVRNRPIAGLHEYQEAAVAVLGAGDATNLRLIDRRWHFDSRLGRVPEDFPAAPLQRDLTALQKRLRIPPAAEEKTLDLDLRETLDRERSHLLRRLRILGVEWARPSPRGPSGKGTFHELWQLLWQPELAVRLVEASRYGHTVERAAAAALAEKSTTLQRLSELVALLDDALFADLADAVQPLVTGIEQRAAAQADIQQLLEAIAPLVNVYRYGNVRATDVTLVRDILDALVPRVLIGLVPAASNIDGDAAAVLWKDMREAERSLAQLGDAGFIEGWRACLGRLAGSDSAHPLIAGYAHRLLYDASVIEFGALADALSRALSPGNAADVAASWVEGLLSGSGTILIHDDRLRALLDGWIRSVPAEHFMQVLPLLRRTFAEFPAPERRLLGERLRTGHGELPAPAAANGEFDVEAARRVLPLLQTIWGKGPAQ
jgi:hypothetical protein